MISIKANLAPQLQQLRAVKRQLPFVAARSLTVAGQAVRSAINAQLGARLDRPKPYTTRQAVQVRQATKQSLVVTVGVGVQVDAPSKGTPYSKVLAHHFTGGRRPFTKFEGALRRAGYMGRGEVAVPGGGAALDSFGNLSQGGIVKIMSILRLFAEQGYRANETDKGRAQREKIRQRRSKGGADYFVRSAGGKRIKRNYVEIGGKVYFVSRGRGHWFGRGSWQQGRDQHLPAGIWEKTGIHGAVLKPLVLFVRAGIYRKQFDMRKAATGVLASDWNRIFNDSFRQAMASAR